MLVQDKSEIYARINQHEFNRIFIERSHSREKSLIRCLASVLYNPTHHEELFKIIEKFQINIKDIVQSYLDYNLDIRTFGNEIYESLPMRVTMHILNLLENSWHQERQKTVLKYLLFSQARSAIDMGFGTPSLYIKYALLHHTPPITLCDFSESAFIFSKALLDQWDSKWSEMISFKKSNMEEKEFIGAFDLYIFQDSIEHVTDPTGYLSQCVRLSPDSAHFLLGLPIGPIIPSHFMAWDSPIEATKWLKSCGLNIKMSKLIKVTPGVDLFAEPFDYKLENFFVLCDKL